jgi:hypothetical protein
MPGELYDKIKLWDVLNRILKNNGLIDFDALEESVRQLKIQLNSLLSNVLGLSHEIDGLHNYNDTPVKTQLAAIGTQAVLNRTDINSLQTRMGTAETKLNGITTDDTTMEIHKSEEIELSTMTDLGHGINVDILLSSIALQHYGEGANGDFFSQIMIGGNTTESGITINSDNLISISNNTHNTKGIQIAANGQMTIEGAKLNVTSNGVEFVGTGDLTGKHVLLPWTNL